MGFVKGQVDIPSLKTGLFAQKAAYLPYIHRVAGTTYTQVLKWTVDFSNIDYIYMMYTMQTDGGNAYSKILAGSTTLVEHANQVDGTDIMEMLDATAVTGENAFIIQLKNSGPDNTWLAPFMMYVTEA